MNYPTEAEVWALFSKINNSGDGIMFRKESYPKYGGEKGNIINMRVVIEKGGEGEKEALDDMAVLVGAFNASDSMDYRGHAWYHERKCYKVHADGTFTKYRRPDAVVVRIDD